MLQIGKTSELMKKSRCARVSVTAARPRRSSAVWSLSETEAMLSCVWTFCRKWSSSFCDILRAPRWPGLRYSRQRPIMAMQWTLAMTSIFMPHSSRLEMHTELGSVEGISEACHDCGSISSLGLRPSTFDAYFPAVPRIRSPAALPLAGCASSCVVAPSLSHWSRVPAQASSARMCLPRRPHPSARTNVRAVSLLNSSQPAPACGNLSFIFFISASPRGLVRAASSSLTALVGKSWVR
mmetsp:Transcript_1939/g.4533  ORF Transcript_1939/g.4533 Transcript_1939/m.4533 type:complete len:238 (+) Transcript_1939:115-828(+)